MSEDAYPSVNESVVRVFSCLGIVSKQSFDLLITCTPTNCVKPELLISFQVLFFHEVDADYVVETVGSWNCCRSFSAGALVGLAIITTEVLFNPTNYFGFTVSELNQTGKVGIGRVTHVVMCDFEVSNLLR